jgi:hypothetical protein
LAKVNVFTGSSRNRARQPETLKTVCVNYSAQHFVTTSRSVDGRRRRVRPKGPHCGCSEKCNNESGRLKL